jgi:hypothetical protein
MCQVCASDYYYDVDAVACLSCDRHKDFDSMLSSIIVLTFLGIIGFAVFAVLLYRISQYYWAKVDVNKNPKLAKKLLNGSRALAAVSAKCKSLTSFAQISNNVGFNFNIR